MAVSHIKSLTVADGTNTNIVRPGDWNSVHNQYYTLSGNTTSASTASGTNVVFAASGGMSVGGNGSQVFFSAPAIQTFSNTIFGPGDIAFLQSTAVSLGQNSLYIWPVVLHEYVTGGVARLPVLVTNSSSATNSCQKGQTVQFGIFTRNATNATVLTQLYSTSYTIAASISSNASMMLSMITAVGNSTSYSTLTASSAGLNLSASLHGARELVMPLSTLMSPGEYWFALLNSTSSGANNAGNVLTVNNVCYSATTANRLGVSINSTDQGYQRIAGHGVYTTTTGAIPTGVSFTQINQGGTTPVVYLATATN